MQEARLAKYMKMSTWFWWSMMLMLLLISSSASIEENIEQQLSYGTVTFDLNTGWNGYTNFTKRLRNILAGPTRACGIPSTRRTPLAGREYVLVQLKISNKQWVTLGIDARDLYVWAYQDNVKYNGQYRATFLDESPEAAQRNLFQGSTRRTTRYRGNYDRLEPAAGISRRDISFGIENLRGAIVGVYGKEESVLNRGRAEAMFFLLAIQMVSEASRFKFMEYGVIVNDKTYAFRAKMVAFQTDWSAISNAIHIAEASTPKCTIIDPPLRISKIDYKQEVTQVDQIKNDMAILLHMSTRVNVEGSSILGLDEI